MSHASDNVSIPDTDDHLELALFKLGYQNQVAAVGAFLLPASIALGYRANLPVPTLYLWLAWMFLTFLVAVAIRWIAWKVQRQNRLDAAFARRWRQWYLYQSIMVGIGWGNIGVLYVPNEIAQNAVLMVVFLGLIAAATNSAASHHLKLAVVGISTAVIFQLLHLQQGFGERALAMQAMLVLYLVVLLNGGRNIHRAVLESIRLRVENEVMLQLKIQEAERADQANRDKSLFLAAASHDLRQPVHALLLLVAALRQRCHEASQLELIGHIQSAGQAIGKLFNALMELSRLESGSEKPEPAEVRVAEALRQTIARHRLEAEHKGLRLTLFISRRAEQAVVDTDRVLLMRIVDNLIANAIRYTARGGVLVALRCRGANCLWLEVRDSGIGIATQDLPRIFDPYFQIGNAERDRSKGLGLGLAIVRQTSALLGTGITVESRVGHGSRFRLTLSGMRLAPAEHSVVPAPHQPSTPLLAGWRILLVDDDQMVLQAMQILLGSWCADLRSAGGVEQCLQVLQDPGWQPDCILCDYRLPGAGNGISLLNQLVDRYPEVVALLQTGELDPQVRDMAEDAGYMVLTKPVDADLLASTLCALRSAQTRTPGTRLETAS